MNSSDIWKREIGQLHDLRLNWNDKLEVVDGALLLTKGPEEAFNGKLSISEPLDLAEHLKFLINTTAASHLNSLKTQPEYYEQVADFKREFKCFNNLVSSLKLIFSPKHACNDTQIIECYSHLYELSSKLFSEIIDYKSSLKKPPLKDRPWKHIEYTERTELSSIKGTYPKRVPLSETIKAAQRALRLAESKVNELEACCVKPLLCCLSTLSLLKVVLWNPLEKLYRGEVTTRTPLKYAIDDFMDTNTHIRAFQKFSCQILNCPLITYEVAMGFAKLAPCATTLDLKNAKFANEELSLDAAHPQIDSYNLSLLIEAASGSKLCNTIHLSKPLLEWDYVQEFLSKHTFIQAADFEHSITYIRKPTF